MRRGLVRKINRNAKLKSLPAERQARIYEYANGKKLTVVAEWLKSEEGISTTRETVSDFLGWYEGNQRSKRIEAIVEGIMAEEKRRNPNITDRRLREIGQEHFTKMMMANEDVRGWYLTQQVALRMDKIDLDREKYQSEKEEKKAAREQEKRRELSGGLRQETLERIEREMGMFGEEG
jgi:hypothetical protein